MEREIQNTEVIKMSDSAESDSTSDYEPQTECACCNQWAETGKLIHCTSCQREYHTYCHISHLPVNFTNTDAKEVGWKCTLCTGDYDSSLENNSIVAISYIREYEQNILERILMELYCQNNESEHFRELLDKNDYPQYYETIKDPISLNEVRDRLLLKKKPYYASVGDVLNDIKKVFLNALSYYPCTDPYHNAAEALRTSLIKLVWKYLPKCADIVHSV